MFRRRPVYLTPPTTTTVRERAPGWFWPIVGAACLVSFVLHGYALHGGDNDFWLPVVQDAAHPDLYPGDAHVDGGHRGRSLHFDVLAWPVRVAGVEWTFFVAYLLAHSLLFGAFAALCRALLEDASAAALSVLLLILPRPIGGTATLSVESFLLPRFVAESLAVLALALAIRHRPVACGLAIGLVLLEHPLTALPVFAAVALRPVLLRAEWRAAMTSLATGTLVGLPNILRFVAQHASQPSGGVGDAEWWRHARAVTTFPFVDLWSDIAWLQVLGGCALLAIGLSVAPRPREALALVLGPIVLALGGIPLTAMSGNVSLVALQPTRSLLLITLLALALAGGLLRRLLDSSARLAVLGGILLGSLLGGWLGLILVSLALAGAALARPAELRARGLAALAGAAAAAFAFIGPWREAALELVAARPLPLAIVGAAGLALSLVPVRLRLRPGVLPGAVLALAAGLLAWVGPGRIEWPWTMPSGPAADIAGWARENTPITARFIVPPDLAGFRALSHRTTMMETGDEANVLFSREQAGTVDVRRRRFGREASIGDLAGAVLSREADVLVLARDVQVPALRRIHSGAHHSAWIRPDDAP